MLADLDSRTIQLPPVLVKLQKLVNLFAKKHIPNLSIVPAFINQATFRKTKARSPKVTDGRPTKRSAHGRFEQGHPRGMEPIGTHLQVLHWFRLKISGVD